MEQLKEIFDNLQNYLGYDIDLKSRKRKQVYARFVYFKAAKHLTNCSLEEIGAFINKDHATVINGIKKFDDVLTRYETKFMKAYNNIISTNFKGDIVVEEINLLTYGLKF